MRTGPCGRLRFMSLSPAVALIGIGADGWDGLGRASRAELDEAGSVLGSPRQLSLLHPCVSAARIELPSPLLPTLGDLVRSLSGQRVAVLASGDPMFFGIGSTLLRIGVAVHVHPAPSSVSLACARMGWAVQDIEVVSVVGRPLTLIHPAIQPGARVLVLVGTADGSDSVRALLADRGFGPSTVTTLAQLGGTAERITSDSGRHDPLAIVAVDCLAAPGALLLPRTPGLPEEAFDHDGQITKREVRALSLAMLAPAPGQLLWDVGAGSGSVGIEWMRTHPTCRAIAVEPRADRGERIIRNAASLGVAGLQLVPGCAPQALAGLPAPDAVFVGGAVSVPGVLDACTDALPPGGRLVANGVTVQTESVLATQHARLGGTLTRLSIQRAVPVGGFTGWRPAMPVTQWAWTKS
jgi:precorrin-6Y C5,15-methyltransferase (decarboxylating)